MKQINTLKPKIIQLLKRTEFFKNFHDNDLILITEGKGMVVLAEEGEVIIRQGDKDPIMYIPLSGQLEARVASADGKGVVVGQLNPGDVIGEITFLTEEERSASVVALTQSVLFRCSKQALRNLAPLAREKIKDQIILVLIERLKQKNLEAAASS